MSQQNNSPLSVRVVVAALLALGVTATQAAGTPVPGMGTWETTLQGRDLDGNASNGFEAFYDTALNITWLADANYADTIGYVSPSFNVGGGYMTLDEGKALVKSLNIGGVTGWRAPSLKDTGKPGCDNYSGLGGLDCGYNVDPSTSELAHLFHVTLGNKSALAPDGTHRAAGDFGLINSGPFKNMQAVPGYGIGTPYAPDNTKIWAFNFSSGIQTFLNKESAGFGWAVHDGDVAAVPEPQSAALMLLGLAGVAALARRKR